MAITEQQWEAICERETEFTRLTVNLTNEQLGFLVRFYLEGAQDTGWEGYTASDLEGITKMMQDMGRAYDTEAFREARSRMINADRED